MTDSRLLSFLDATIGPSISVDLVRGVGIGVYHIKCECGFDVITNRKYRMTKEDVEKIAFAHMELEHSDRYVKQ